MTRVELAPQLVTVEVHGASRVSPRFSLVARCRCSANFGGANCERPQDVCATTTCTAPRICVPSPSSPLSQHACVCPLPWTGPNCDRLPRPPTSNSVSLSGAEACFSEACFLQRGALAFFRLSIFTGDRFHCRFYFLVTICCPLDAESRQIVTCLQVNLNWK